MITGRTHRVYGVDPYRFGIVRKSRLCLKAIEGESNNKHQFIVD